MILLLPVSIPPEDTNKHIQHLSFSREQRGEILSFYQRIKISPFGRNDSWSTKGKIMKKEYKIVAVEEPEWGIIGKGLREFNTQQAGDDQYQNLCFVINGPDQEVVGGIIGATYWEWFYVDLLWVKEELRGCGYGHHLLTLAEDEARLRGAKNAYLDTFSFQVPNFYKQHGYEVFGELPDFPPGHQRYFMKKRL
jgi:GNAT superfamily N-acetyltransferase